MRPGHIRVFDGLRFTTEHMEHFQSSVHSAIQDLREIIGLGVVCYGFEVVADGPNRITVQPGLAFDFQRNRVVCDEPKSVDVNFEEQEKEKYVCVQYDQIQDGEVEGQFTLIWDSCSISVAPSLPGPEDNVIVLAKLARNESDANFDVVSLDPEGDVLSLPQIESSAGEPPALSDSSTNVTEAAAPVSPAPTAVTNPEGSPVSESSSESTAAPVSEPRQTLHVKQGITRCGNDAGVYLKTILLEPLLLKFQTGKANGAIDLGVPLGRAELVPDADVFSLTTHCILSTTLSLQSDAQPTETVTESYESCALRAVASGEATIENGAIAQFGLSVIHSDQQACPSCASSEFTEQAIAQLPFASAWAGVSQIYNEALSRLKIHLQVGLTGSGSLEAVAFLRWSGTVTEELLKEIESRKCGLVWQAVIGWKSMSGE